MLNVHSAGHERYIPAPELRQLTTADKFKLCVGVAFDVLKVLLLSVPLICQWVVHLFVPTPRKSVRGFNALITGGANGIGKAVALELAGRGCNIIIADIDDVATRSTVEELKGFGVQCIGFKVDVADPEQVEKLKEDIANIGFGEVNILVNNAGLMPLLSLREGHTRDIDRIIKVNVHGNIWTLRTFLKEMIERKQGHIVQISSMSALHALPSASVYTATKYAVTGMMRAFEEELRQEGHGDYIHFTTVYPYFVSTRKDLMDALQLRFPAITATQTAEKILDGILTNNRRVVIPSGDDFVLGLIRAMPFKLQCLVRDYILREAESKVFKNPYNMISSNKYN